MPCRLAGPLGGVMQRALGRSTDHFHALAGGGVIERVPQPDEPLLAYVIGRPRRRSRTAL